MQQLMGAFADGVVLALPVIAMVGLATIVGIFRRRHDPGQGVHALGAGIMVAGLVLIAATTLLPVSAGSSASVNLNPGETIRNYLQFGDDLLSARNLGLNVALFVPFGLGLALWRRWGMIRVTLLGGLLSVLVETAQYLLPLGRAVDIDDVVLNTIGAALGALTVSVARLAAPRPAEQARRPPVAADRR